MRMMQAVKSGTLHMHLSPNLLSNWTNSRARILVTHVKVGKDAERHRDTEEVPD